MKFTYMLIFIGIAFIISSCSYKPIGASMKSEKLKESDYKSITLLRKNIEFESKDWGARNKSYEKEKVEVEEEIELIMGSLFINEGIDLHNPKDSLFSEQELNELDEVMSEMNNIYSSKETRRLGIIESHPNFDFTQAESSIQTSLGLYLSFSGSEHSFYGIPGGGGSTTQNYMHVNAYLIDVSNNQIVWVYFYREDETIEKISPELYLKSIIMSLKYGRDIMPHSFDITPSNIRYKITRLDGSTFYGSIDEISGLNIEMTITGGKRSINFGEISIIETPASVKVFPFEI